MNLSRRTLLGGALTGLGTGALAKGWTVENEQKPKPGKRPKNIIFCVADGMPISAVTCVDHLRIIKEGKRSYWAWLYDQPFVYNGLQDTRSLNSIVTDSSAASSAWGSGRHIWNGMTNMFPDKTPLRTLTEIFSAKGIRCGLVTTATMTHATPSGFAVQCVSRDLEGLIAEKYIGSGVDVLLGGGDKFFSADIRKDKLDLYSKFASAGYKVVKTRDDLMKASDRKVLGIFSNSHIPYWVDHENDAKLRATVPTLAEMSKVAIELLNKDAKNGFLLQIEGARVDHGNHSNDAAAALFDQIAFEDAVKVAIDFAMKDGETLVIITSDHACGGLALNGAGDEYIESTEGLKKLLGFKSTFAPFVASIGTPTAANVQAAAEAKFGIQLKEDDANLIVSSMKGDHPFKGSQFFRSLNGTIGMVLGNYTKITFTSGNHHNDHVLVTAYGPGSERCAGLTQNIEFFDLMLDMRGMKHSNPTMTFGEAAPLYEKLQKELNPELYLQYADTDEESCGGAFDHNYRSWA